MSAPDDLVLVGHVMGAFGVHGWVRVRPYSSHAAALLSARHWWCEKGTLRDVDKRQAKMHGDDVVAQLIGVVDRNAAEAMKGTLLYISRRYFPPLEDNEFYWVDLIGMSVKNTEGVFLGEVVGLMESGAHAILRVKPEKSADDKTRQQEVLIPFIDQFVPHIDHPEKMITVDWESDYAR